MHCSRYAPLIAVLLVLVAQGQQPGYRSDIGVSSADTLEVLALTSAEASLGHFDRALERLTAARDQAAPELAGLVDRSLRRLRALRALRAEFVADSCREGRALSFHVEGRRTTVRLESVADDQVFLRVKPELVVPVALSDYRSREFKIDAQEAGVFEGERSWMGAYLAILAGISRYGSFLGDDSESEALKGDAKLLEELVSRGGPLILLDEVATCPWPDDEGGVQAVLERIVSLRTLAARDPFLATKGKLLERCAADLIALLWDPKRADHLGVHGIVEETSTGYTSITYHFKEQVELSDFPEKKYQELRRRNRPLTTSASSGFRIVRGIRAAEVAEKGKNPRGRRPKKGKPIDEVHASGSGNLRFKVPLKAPFQITYELYFDTADSNVNIKDEFIVFLCARGRSFLAVKNLGDLEAIDRADGLNEKKPSPDRDLKVGKPYLVTLTHDGKALHASVNGSARNKIATGRLDSGWLNFWVQSDRVIRMSRLRIIGTVDLERAEELRDAWVESQMTSYRFEGQR